MRILLGSGSGYIGRHIKSFLSSKGHRVETISRDKNKGTYTWTDLNNNDITGDFDAVIDMSGKNIFTGNWADVVSSRKYACESIVKWILRQQTPPKIWIAPSAVGIYPCGIDSSWVESDVECRCDTTPGPHMTKMQKFVLDWEKSALLPEELNSSTSHISLRLGVVLGNGSEFFKALKNMIGLHAGFQLEPGNQIVPWIHVDDIVGVIAHCIERSQQSPIQGPYNVVSPMAFSTSYKDILECMENFTQRQQIYNLMPKFCQSAVRYSTSSALRLYFGQELYDLMAKSQKVLPERLIQEGYKFKFNRVESALKDSIGTN